MTFDAYHKWLGIPAAEQPPNHYRLLAVTLFEDDPDVIETAADQRMALLRTFQAGQHSALSQKLLNELSAARLCLLTPEKKSAYDAELHRQIDAARQPAPIPPTPQPLTAAQPRPPAATPLEADTPALIVTGGGARRGAQKRRRGLGSAASAWLALAAVAIPAGLFIVYLISTKRPTNVQTRPAPLPEAQASNDRDTPKPQSTAPPPEPQTVKPTAAALSDEAPAVPMPPSEVASLEVDSEGFVPLFNGQDLSGWEMRPNRPGAWRVENGVLIGSGEDSSYLVTERGNFTNFHLRAEARVNDGGESGVYCRAAFGPDFWPGGYEAQINTWEKDNLTGSLYAWRSPGPLVRVTDSHVRANEWFKLEVIAIDNHIVVKVNGETTADHVDSSRRFSMGRIALEKYRPNTVVEFRKIEMREGELEPKIAENDPQRTPQEQSQPRIVSQRFPCDIRGASGEDWSIDGNELARRADLPESTILFGDPSWVDYDFLFDAKVLKGWYVRIFFRYQDEANFHSYGIGAWDNIRELVDTMEGGRWGSRQFERRRSLAMNTWYAIRIEVRGQKGRCYLNGDSAGEFTMPHLSQGRVGFVVEKKASYQFRNIVVKSPDGAVLLEGLPEFRVAGAGMAASKETSADKPQAGTRLPPRQSRDRSDLGKADVDGEKAKLTAKEAFSLRHHTAAVTRIAFHRTLPVLASAGKDGQVLLWNLQTRSMQLQVHKYPEEVWTVKFHPTLDVLAYANRRWWGSRLFFKTLAGVQVGQPIKDFKDPGGEVWTVAYSPDGRLLAAGQVDGTIRLWDSKPFRESSPVGLGDRHNVYALAFGPMTVDRKLKQTTYLLAEGGEDGEVRTYSVTIRNDGQWSFQKTSAGFPKASAILGLRFSPDGKLLGSTRRGGAIELYDPQSPANVRQLVGDGRGRAWWIGFHPHYPKVPWCVTAHQNSQAALIWNTETRDVVCELKGHTGGVMCAEFSPDGRHVATASEDLSIKLWDLAGAEVPAAPTRRKKAKLLPLIVGE